MLHSFSCQFSSDIKLLYLQISLYTTSQNFGHIFFHYYYFPHLNVIIVLNVQMDNKAVFVHCMVSFLWLLATKYNTMIPKRS